MKPTIKIFAYAVIFLFPGIARAQGLGQVRCAKPDDYTYLYSSVSTMEVRSQLKCGEEIQILNRYDNFLYVRTDKGDIGYVPLESIALVKTKRGAKPAPAGIGKKAAPSAPQMLTLLDGTPVRLKLGRNVSSADAHAGDEVPFEVTEDVVVSGFTVIRKGTKASGTVAEAAPKGRFGHNGKLSLNLTAVRLVDNETAGLRMYQESKSERHGVSKVLPVKSGKDITLAEGTEMFGYVSGGMHLLAAKFPRSKESATSASTGAAHP
jgi:hypothetical protein